MGFDFKDICNANNEKQQQILEHMERSKKLFSVSKEVGGTYDSKTDAIEAAEALCEEKKKHAKSLEKVEDTAIYFAALLDYYEKAYNYVKLLYERDQEKWDSWRLVQEGYKSTVNDWMLLADYLLDYVILLQKENKMLQQQESGVSTDAVCEMGVAAKDFQMFLYMTVLQQQVMYMEFGNMGDAANGSPEDALYKERVQVIEEKLKMLLRGDGTEADEKWLNDKFLEFLEDLLRPVERRPLEALGTIEFVQDTGDDFDM